MGREYEKAVIVKSTTPAPVKQTFFEDFENTINWLAVSSPAGGAGAVDSTISYTNSKSYKLNTRASTPAINDYAEMSRSIARLASNKIRYSAFVRPGATQRVDIKMEVTEGGTSNSRTFGIRIDTNASTMYYLDSAGSWVAFATIGLYDPSDNFQLISMDIDQANGKYLRANINDQQVDLSNITARSTTTTRESRSNVMSVRVTNTDTDQSIIYVDTVTVEAIGQ